MVEQEILKLKNVKVSFALEVKFSIEKDGETQNMKYYFENKKLYIFNRYDKEEIKEKFDEFIENTEGEIEVSLTKEKLWESYGKPWAIYGPYMGMVWKGRVVYGTDMGPYFGKF